AHESLSMSTPVQRCSTNPFGAPGRSDRNADTAHLLTCESHRRYTHTPYQTANIAAALHHLIRLSSEKDHKKQTVFGSAAQTLCKNLVPTIQTAFKNSF